MNTRGRFLVKKHISQMSPSEINLLEKRRRELLKNPKPFRCSKHFLKNSEKRGISMAESIETVKKGYIIEYHERISRRRVIDKRILIWSHKVYKNRYNLFVVCSLWYKSLITAYYNNKNDHHRTLDYSNYDNRCRIRL